MTPVLTGVSRFWNLATYCSHEFHFILCPKYIFSAGIGHVFSVLSIEYSMLARGTSSPSLKYCVTNCFGMVANQLLPGVGARIRILRRNESKWFRYTLCPFTCCRSFSRIFNVGKGIFSLPVSLEYCLTSVSACLRYKPNSSWSRSRDSYSLSPRTQGVGTTSDRKRACIWPCSF